MKTCTTPGTASAAAVSIAAIFPRAMLLDTTTPCSRPGAANSAAYRAAPVTLASPSTRLCGEPK
ncbi:hypothetical protein MVG78_06715 [Roseomonas gilardii subsp. gilardii]|uniref:hypothetical protein n=1 Tax=Roseomonas gilardii TaxID=257708 RepID=UPI001FFB169D|nr:hypothetical protein [Roseomonas gilardii]UPG74491.1 hypothetical protein MVG78_06715 [Roseomonas gilardii subsp. gilardii]